MAASSRLPTLKKRAEFVRIARDGRKAALPGVVLQGRLREDDGGSPARVRIGITATRKLGGAVVRNRIRRRLRAVAQTVILCGKPGWDFVLIGRSATLDRPFRALLGDVETALKRMGAYVPAAPVTGGGAGGAIP